MASAPSAQYSRAAVPIRSLAPRAIGRHWPIALIAVVAAVLLLTNLGGEALWEDEGDTAVLARSILRHGIPVAWDGVTFLDPDYGQRLGFGLVMVSHPWLQYYAAAASFAVLGESAATARVPFALAGIATIVVTYLMGVELFRSRRIACCAALLLTASVQFLLFARQARNYPFHALLTCLLIWQFLRLDSWKRSVGFALLGIALFHTHPLGVAAVGALAALTFISPDFRSARRWCWPAALAVGVYAAPWVVVSQAGHSEAATSILGLRDLAGRVAQFFVEYGSVAPVVGSMLLGVVLWRRAKGSRVLSLDERKYVAACAVLVVTYAAAVAATQTPTDVWVLGLHHTPALLPLTALIAALLIVKVSGQRRLILATLVLAFVFTRGGQLVPWVVLADPVAQPASDTGPTFHVPPRMADRILRTTQLQFARALVQPNPGVMSQIGAYLRTHAAPGDIVLTNAESQALYFHTGLPQAAKVARSFPIYAVARERNLPEYVFGYERLKWIVWRRSFPAYFPEQDVAALLKRLAALDIKTELVASFTETVFENRENIHFRRYPGSVYIFPWHTDIPEARIYRVHWPTGPERWYVQGNALFAKQQYAAAIEEYQRLLRVEPDHQRALARVGVAYVLAGRSMEGIEALRKALQIDPNDSAVALTLANALYGEQQLSEAALYARRAVTLNPNDPMAYDVLGRVLGVQGHLVEAARQFEQALRVDPDFADAQANLNALKALGAL